MTGMLRKILGRNPRLTLKILKLLFRAQEFIRVKINTFAIIYGGHVHPKHRLMKYHKFFTDTISSEDVVVDIGCGKGELAFELASKAKMVIACDTLKRYIDFARSHNQAQNLKYYNVSIMDLRLDKEVPEGACVTAVLSSVLEHIDESTALLKYLRKFCKKVLIRVPDIERNWEVVFKRELGMPYFLDPTHKREYSEESLKEELRQSGWRVTGLNKKFSEIWAVAV